METITSNQDSVETEASEKQKRAEQWNDLLYAVLMTGFLILVVAAFVSAGFRSGLLKGDVYSKDIPGSAFKTGVEAL